MSAQTFNAWLDDLGLFQTNRERIATACATVGPVSREAEVINMIRAAWDAGADSVQPRREAISRRAGCARLEDVANVAVVAGGHNGS